MSVVIETTIGDITVDLYLKERPNTCFNFLKLCKMKYYNFCLFYKVERNFMAQTGDPDATGRGGESIYSTLYGPQAKYFEAELKPRMKHEKIGTLSMVNNGGNMNGSQFFLTLGENLTYLDEVHTVFGEVAEGLEVLSKINEIICDQNNRPYQDIRITHTVILHDPYPDPTDLSIPDASPEPTKEMLETDYIAPDEELDDTKGKNIEEIEEKIKDSEAKARATILEMVGDIPDAEVKPPENVLFVCKLNPVTTSEDLELIFSRFGTIVSCEVIKDKKSGESLQYAFIEFEKEEDCENAYFKMDNVLIDDRRIHVDFSQSVAKLNWNQNKVGQGKPGRFQNFVLKRDAKKSDGYEMIFDTNDDTILSSNRGKNRRGEKTRDTKSYHSSRESHKDKYLSRSRDVQASKRMHEKQRKSKRSRSPSESKYYTKEHNSKFSQKSSATKSSDYQSRKKVYREENNSSDSSPSPKPSKEAVSYKEKYSKDQKSKHSYEKSHSSDKTKSRSYDYSARHFSSNDNGSKYFHTKSNSPLLRKKKDMYSSSSDEKNYSKSNKSSQSKNHKPSKSHIKSSSIKNKHKTSDSSSGDEENYSKSYSSNQSKNYQSSFSRKKSFTNKNKHITSYSSDDDEENYSKSNKSSQSKNNQPSIAHKKSSTSKNKRKTSDSSSSDEEYVPKKSLKLSDNSFKSKGKNYEDSSKQSSRKQSFSPEYLKSTRKSSPVRHKDKRNKHGKINKYSSSDDSDSYVSQSKLSKSNASSYKHSQKSSRRRRSSS